MSDLIEDKKENIAENDDIENKALLVLLEKNVQISEEILSLTKYIKKYIFLQKVMFWVKLFLIIIPLLIAFLCLPPFIKEISGAFRSVMGISGDLNEATGLLQGLIQ